MTGLPPHTQRYLQPPAVPEEVGDLVPGMLVGGNRYRIDRLIAVGGMGTVWAAWDLQLERTVAVKFMAARVAHSSLLRQRFTREAKAAAGLRTPHVVQIFDYGLDRERPYIVMELLEGEDLNLRLKRVGRLSLADTVRVADHTAKALRRAHESGVVHRDLKPQNIFLAKSDDDEVVKVLDFGIAKMNDPLGEGESTRTGAVIGSPHYMSPEQARGLRDVDHRTDLWALGVILFRCVTGQLAFRGEATGDVIVRICSDPLPLASQMAPELGPAMDAFFLRALARPVSERFQSAVELAQAFHHAVAAAVGADPAQIGTTRFGRTGPGEADSGRGPQGYPVSQQASAQGAAAYPALPQPSLPPMRSPHAGAVVTQSSSAPTHPLGRPAAAPATQAPTHAWQAHASGAAEVGQAGANTPRPPSPSSTASAEAAPPLHAATAPPGPPAHLPAGPTAHLSADVQNPGFSLAAIPGTTGHSTLTNASGELDSGAGRRRVRIAALLVGALALSIGSVAAVVVVGGSSQAPPNASGAPAAESERGSASGGGPVEPRATSGSSAPAAEVAPPASSPATSDTSGASELPPPSASATGAAGASSASSAATGVSTGVATHAPPTGTDTKTQPKTTATKPAGTSPWGY